MELHQSGEIIAQRYRIETTLGQGGIGITYEALDLQNNQPVALKVLSLRRMNDWKAIELFERESKILSQLNHPAIPHYLDYFQIDTNQDRGFYLVQQLAVGKSLAATVENGWNPDEAEVRDIAIQILEILVYLQQLTPPIIHRDIKTQNIIRQENGRIFLVDFGAVQDVYHHTVTGGSTVVGTYGYMAPEQFRGQAVLSTDLYGLGTTLLFLLTQTSPADLPTRQLKINFRSRVSVCKEFADWLEKTIEPIIEDRFPSAKAALAVLQGKQTLSSYSVQRRPKDSAIALTKTEESLVVEIPIEGFCSNFSIILAVILLLGNGLLLQITWLILKSFIDNVSASIKFFFLAVYAPVGVWMLKSLLVVPLSHSRLEIDKDNIRLRQWLLGWCYHDVTGRTEITQIKLTSTCWHLNKKHLTVSVLKWHTRKHHFGLFMTKREKEWLIAEINAFLQK